MHHNVTGQFAQAATAENLMVEILRTQGMIRKLLQIATVHAPIDLTESIEEASLKAVAEYVDRNREYFSNPEELYRLIMAQ